MPALTRQKKITFGEMRAAGVRGLLIYCSDYKCNHSTAPFVNCFTYAERGLIYQAPGVQRALEVAEWMLF